MQNRPQKAFFNNTKTLALSKRVDALQVKKVMWDHINEKLNEDVVMEGEEEEKQSGVTMSSMLANLFQNQVLDESVSIASAFVCMLHLGNE